MPRGDNQAGRTRLTGARKRRIATVLDAVASSLTRVAIQSGSTVLVAVSGGADSIALLHAMLELREQFDMRIVAAHLNHRLRGAESDRDENFVRDMCSRQNVELIVERAETLAGHSSNLEELASNLEERAREARHDFLNRAANTVGATHIALAHQAGDQAETVLMRLLRGSGVAGLAAMSERGPGRLIRPMLALRRDDILAYLHELDLPGEPDLPYVEDSTNASPIFLRNRIRAELLPLLEREYAPGLGIRLAELASEMRSLDELVGEIAVREIESMRVDDSALDVTRLARLNRAVQAGVIRTFMHNRIGDLRRIDRDHIDDVLRLAVTGGSSDSIDLPRGWRASREYNLLRLTGTRAKTSLDYSVPLSFDGTTLVEAAGYVFEASTIGIADAILPSNERVAIFDAAVVAESGLIVRNFIAGDRIHPLGMTGVKKVKSVFIDRKVPASKRGSFPIVALDGEPTWIPGLVRDNRATISSTTETVLRVEACATTA